MKRTIITIIIVAIAIAGAAFVLTNNKKKMQEQTDLAKKVNPTTPVQVAEVKEENVGGTFTATGTFAPSKQTVVVTEVAGKVLRISTDEGQYVTKGQLLARIEFATLAADLQSAEANLQKLSTDKARYERLVKSGGVTQAQLDDINLNYVNAEARAIAARKKLTDTYIKAPFAGFVNKRYVEEGAYVGAGKEMFEIVETTKLKMIVNVSESQVLAANEAKNVRVTADVYPGAEYPAKVKFIAAKADANLNFPVELEISNIKNKPLRAGMYGRATFEMPSGRTGLLIPRAALIGSINDAQVYVVNGDSVQLKNIVAGTQYANTIEVVEGLSKGDKVVTSGQINLVDGAKVTVLNK
ncbi:efflux RND transporter periplasmic adaptor subunit [Chryseosolibacter indicus]|uniref:Efflux RND transporter periplasmic adaptor subunit n=1 Tax=Chryseosolibacter indicus TaxID=2782351 RepID=A0ABS5VXY0_9BACT|nr:efflux RND transporter periplasmic adaptor subunit [Chryseosolibacter indicus]MBT1705725.1 efflux RND transporter periplasmic adaptor subunit [Chryseosolibacter indicus]